jgi:hypothetical protein
LDIDVIARTGHPKSMPNPCLLIGRGLKNDGGIPLVPSKLFMLRSQAVLPPPMDANQWSQAYLESHVRNYAPTTKPCHEYQVLSNTQARTPKSSPLQRASQLDCLALSHCQVIINKVCGNGICHHSQCDSHPFGMCYARALRCNSSSTQEGIMDLHTFCNMLE